MSNHTIDRRDFIKSGIAASTALAVGLPVSQDAAAQAKSAEAGIAWDKSVCRFCGTGCGILVGTQAGKVVATKGDPDAPVNRGLNCIKGYFNGKILYGADRLTQPLMRVKDGKFDKNAPFQPVSWKVAMDEMERQFRKAYETKGPSGVAIIGSGQYTIPEAYAASKLMKAGFRSNNLDPNARLCMASAVVAFYQVFGIDEPANVYADIEKSNAMILWGNNMAEAHPVLWSRVTDRKLTHKDTKIVNLTTCTNMSSGLADLEIIMKPSTDLAIQNYIAREIIARGAVNQAFVDKHCIFATGPADIGYGLRPTDQYAYPAEKDILAKQKVVTLDKYEAIAQRRKEGDKVEQKNAGPGAGSHWSISFDEFKRGVEPYTLDFVAELAKGDDAESLDSFKKKLVALADLYIDPKRDVVSFWCMGFNQHQRGVWVNEQCYTNHLLLGKHARPGNGAFSLTGQPSACGSAREVGAFCHRLPSDMLVNIKPHRAKTEKLWKLPENTLNPHVGASIMHILQGLEDGKINFVWTQVVNIFQSTPNSNHWLQGARRPDAFVVVADAYPTLSAKVADLILPSSMIFEKWGLYGNAERRTQAWRQQVAAPGEARTDTWMLMEFSKRFKLKDVWGEKKIPGLKAEGFADNTLPDVLAEAQKMGYSPEATLYDVLFATPENKKVAWPDPKLRGKLNGTAEALGDKWFVEKALFNEYRQFTLGDGHDLADFDTYMRDDLRGLTWPVVDGKETVYRFNDEFDPYVKKGLGFDFYGKLMKAIPTGNLDGVTDPKPVPLPGKAKIFFRPYAAPAEQPDANYDLWLCTGRILEHWHTGSMTRRVPELHRAAPTAVLYMNPADAAARGIKRNDVAWIESRRGKVKAVVETQGRNKMPRGSVWAAFFDEGMQINKVVLDTLDPISLEPDFKKSAVKVSKA
ncbi:MAG TPA: nitrate reductase catalytic subunit NapA [Burkholderiaceae bacterium]|nr:nitrate reductase catalytic subunit NapA [Burkholderiaceae bacterium]HPE01668.1 nitrate reductase catalytic subunit NapA [Burkholderiaceae bacterium]HRZ01424.1 nitrate reductase catalytic subunit NapA [Burkholderiaceae bacterium]